jgi:hypothetical protein
MYSLEINSNKILTWKLYLGIAHDCIRSFFMTFLSMVNQEPYAQVSIMDNHDTGHMIRSCHMEVYGLEAYWANPVLI